jgi:hypothetical protein
MAKPPLTDLDKKLFEIACKNQAQFIALIGEEAWIAAKVCLLRQDKKSYGEISIRLSLTKEQARYACNKCENISNENA